MGKKLSARFRDAEAAAGSCHQLEVHLQVGSEGSLAFGSTCCVPDAMWVLQAHDLSGSRDERAATGPSVLAWPSVEQPMMG